MNSLTVEKKYQYYYWQHKLKDACLESMQIEQTDKDTHFDIGFKKYLTRVK